MDESIILIELNFMIKRSVDGLSVMGKISKLFPSWQRTSKRSSSQEQPAGHNVNPIAQFVKVNSNKQFTMIRSIFFQLTEFIHRVLEVMNIFSRSVHCLMIGYFFYHL